MHEVLIAIGDMATLDPERVAIASAGGSVTYGDLFRAIVRLRGELADCPSVVGTLMGRSATAIAADLALASMGRTIVPLPPFFSLDQWRHIVADAGVNAIVTDDGAADRVAGIDVPVMHVAAADAAGDIPAGGWGEGPRMSRRVIYTSGTTGRPKGVILDEDTVSASLAAMGAAVGANAADVHFSILPFSLLLEQIAGVLLPLKVGARIHLAQSMETFPVEAEQVRPSTTILVPDLLAGWAGYLRQTGRAAPSSLRFVAAGGAPVGEALAEAAWSLGLPVHEGYGLSECCSVVAVNRPGARVAGTVGRPLDGVEVRLDEGEIVVSGPTVMSGYLGGAPVAGEWRTGDVGAWDDDGNLVVHGRKDDIVVTPAGRNVHPEWIEPMLLADPRVLRAAVVPGRMGVKAVVVVADGGGPTEWILRIEELTAAAPAYARPVEVSCLSPDEARKKDLFTPDGRPRRRRIAQTLSEDPMTFYEALIDATTPNRKAFLNIPVIRGALESGVEKPLYMAFLASAYHHVRHTVPLLRAALAKCGADDGALADGLIDYIREETGHDEWILDDIEALGGDKDATRNARPPLPVRAMVAYAYHLIEEEGPYALLGMVHVLEGMSVALALKAAESIRARVEPKPGGAAGENGEPGFTYLTSHGKLDVGHVNEYAVLLDAVDTLERRAIVFDAARDFYSLYGDIFRALQGQPEGGRHAA